MLHYVWTEMWQRRIGAYFSIYELNRILFRLAPEKRRPEVSAATEGTLLQEVGEGGVGRDPLYTHTQLRAGRTFAHFSRSCGPVDNAWPALVESGRQPAHLRQGHQPAQYSASLVSRDACALCVLTCAQLLPVCQRAKRLDVFQSIIDYLRSTHAGKRTLQSASPFVMCVCCVSCVCVVYVLGGPPARAP